MFDRSITRRDYAVVRAIAKLDEMFADVLCEWASPREGLKVEYVHGQTGLDEKTEVVALIRPRGWVGDGLIQCGLTKAGELTSVWLQYFFSSGPPNTVAFAMRFRARNDGSRLYLDEDPRSGFQTQCWKEYQRLRSLREDSLGEPDRPSCGSGPIFLHGRG